MSALSDILEDIRRFAILGENKGLGLGVAVGTRLAPDSHPRQPWEAALVAHRGPRRTRCQQRPDTQGLWARHCVCEVAPGGIDGLELRSDSFPGPVSVKFGSSVRHEGDMVHDVTGSVVRPMP